MFTNNERKIKHEKNINSFALLSIFGTLPLMVKKNIIGTTNGEKILAFIAFEMSKFNS